MLQNGSELMEEALVLEVDHRELVQGVRPARQRVRVGRECAGGGVGIGVGIGIGMEAKA